MEICAEHSVPVLVNDDVMAAIRARAHGAHVGQEDMPAPVARRLLGDSWLGVSTHDLAQVQRAAHDGADYVGFGPCYPTATKGYEHGLPPSVIEEAVHESPVPVFAIGGIRPNNVNLLVGLGVKRVAVSSAILQAENPRAVAEDLLGRW